MEFLQLEHVKLQFSVMCEVNVVKIHKLHIGLKLVLVMLSFLGVIQKRTSTSIDAIVIFHLLSFTLLMHLKNTKIMNFITSKLTKE